MYKIFCRNTSDLICELSDYDEVISFIAYSSTNIPLVFYNNDSMRTLIKESFLLEDCIQLVYEEFFMDVHPDNFLENKKFRHLTNNKVFQEWYTNEVIHYDEETLIELENEKDKWILWNE